MQKHTKIYYDQFNLKGDDFVIDEIMWVKRKEQVKANDIHHIHQKGMGGSKTKDYIENLIALSRDNHILAHANSFTREWLTEVHAEFIKSNPYD